MNKYLVLYTMKGCPHCDNLKKMLVNEEIEFFERDIDENSEEYDIFVEITSNEYVPAFMIIEEKGSNTSTKLYAPDRDFNTLDEGVEIIKKEII